MLQGTVTKLPECALSLVLPHTILQGDAEQGTCLFEAKQTRLLADFVCDKGLQLSPGVGLMGGAIWIEDLTQNQDIVLAPDWVRGDADRAAVTAVPVLCKRTRPHQRCVICTVPDSNMKKQKWHARYR